MTEEIKILDAEQAAEALRMTTRRLIKVARKNGLCLVYGRKVMFTASQLAEIASLPHDPNLFRDDLRVAAEEVGFDLNAFMSAPPPNTYENFITHWTYAMVSGELVKIGVAKDVERRLHEMRLTNPHPLRIAHVEPSRSLSYALLVERTTHKVLADCAAGREWFRVDEMRAVKALTVVAAAARRFGDTKDPARIGAAA